MLIIKTWSRVNSFSITFLSIFFKCLVPMTSLSARRTARPHHLMINFVFVSHFIIRALQAISFQFGPLRSFHSGATSLTRTCWYHRGYNAGQVLRLSGLSQISFSRKYPSFLFHCRFISIFQQIIYFTNSFVSVPLQKLLFLRNLIKT